MGADPQPEDAEPTFTNVVNSTVSQARRTLSSFSDITWQNKEGDPVSPPDNWIVSAQSPGADIGKAEPTNLHIILTVGAPPPLW